MDPVTAACAKPRVASSPLDDLPLSATTIMYLSPLQHSVRSSAPLAAPAHASWADSLVRGALKHETPDEISATFNELREAAQSGSLSKEQLVTALKAQGASGSLHGLIHNRAPETVITAYMEGLADLCQAGVLDADAVFAVLTAGRSEGSLDPCYWALGEDHALIHAMGSGVMDLSEKGCLTNHHLRSLLLDHVGNEHPLQRCLLTGSGDRVKRIKALTKYLVNGVRRGVLAGTDVFRTLTDRRSPPGQRIAIDTAFSSRDSRVLAATLNAFQQLHDCGQLRPLDAIDGETLRGFLKPQLAIAEEAARGRPPAEAAALMKVVADARVRLNIPASN